MNKKLDHDEFLAAYEAYAEAIYRHCFFKVFSKERAQDLMQETFMKTWQYLCEGKKVENIRAFLYRVANNLIIDAARKKKEESLEDLMEAAKAMEPSYEGEKAIQSSAMISQMKEVMLTLPDEYREVLTLRYIDDLDPKEIAHILGISPNNVSVRLNRATKALKGHFDEPT